LLAGGLATRLGGLDKAWLRRDGIPQVQRIAQRFAGQVSTVLISANREQARYVQAGLQVIGDRHDEVGPIGGLEALAAACTTRWLLSVPVDIIDTNDCLLPSLAAAGTQGAYAQDEAGVQPLVALWPAKRLAEAAAGAISRGEFAVQALQRDLQMTCVPLPGVRFGNLNTPADLLAAGIQAP